MIVDIYIGTDKVELFEDENISITSSILDIQDISKNTTDYTKSFTVPASEINNKIFKHYYDANIDNTFDARVSVDGRIEIGGMPFRLGKFLLQKVSVKSGVASAYTINFWGNLVSLKDVLGSDKLSDLDLHIYNYIYTSDEVLEYLTSFDSQFSALLYSLIVKKRYYYNSNVEDDTMTDELANIHYKEGTDNGIEWDDLQPSLSLISIIVAIENDYNITFSRDFFGSTVFNQLYMWLNNSTDEKVGGDTLTIDWNEGSDTYMDFATNTATFPVGSNTWNLKCDIRPDVGSLDVKYTVKAYVKGKLYSSKDYVGRNIHSFTRSSPFTVYYTITSEELFTYTAVLNQTNYLGVNKETRASEDQILSLFYVDKHIPELKIIDFLKGLFHAFKLVVIPQDDGSIYVDTVVNYYDGGQTIDLTDYIDNEKVDVSRGKVLNNISYKFQEPKTILNAQFKENTGLGYGDEDAELRDSEDVLLDGESFEIELPFEQIVYERLNDTSGVDQINLMYGAVIDAELKKVNPKAHIFFNQQRSVFGSGIGFIQDDGTKIKIRGGINMPSHVDSDSNQQEAFIFSEEYNNFNGELISNNLYTNYHQEYINSLFDVKKRNFRFRTKVLPVSILLDLSLDDTIKIGYNYYRIDKFTTDLTTGKTELNLINL